MASKASARAAGKKTAKAVRLTFAPEQRFECTSCPARCCQLPWAIRLLPEEVERYLGDPWVTERAGPEGLAVIERQSVLPVRERAGLPACVFLDDDDLCSLQKEFGHAFLPRSCQAFPFGFVRDEADRPTAQLSRLCPSVRDDYGAAAEPQLPAKLEQCGSDERMSKALATLDGTIVSQAQYLELCGRWERELAQSSHAGASIAALLDATRAFEAALPGGVERIGDADFERALAAFDGHRAVPLTARAGSTFDARLLFAHVLGNLSRPARALLPHRIGPAGALLRIRAWMDKLSWMLERGAVDLLFVPKRVPLGRVRRVARFLGTGLGEPVGSYLAQVLSRRHVFSQPRHLLAVLLDLGLATAILSRFARCRAAADGRAQVEEADVREGIAVAELVLLSHASLHGPSPMLSRLRTAMLAAPERARGVLAVEA